MEIFECEEGYYCPSNNRTTSQTSIICPENHYCPGNTADPIPCPLGEYQIQQGSGSCKKCEAGFYCRRQGDGTVKREICPQKFYCPEGSDLPEKCPPGTYVIAGQTGLQAPTDCQICPTGQYCRDGERRGACMSGFLCHSGSDAPNPKYGQGITLDVGFDEFQNIVFNFSKEGIPIDCGVGDVCAGPCPPGFYCYKNQFTELSDISPCPANTIRDVPGGMSPDHCRTCPAGVHCKRGDGKLNPCPAGHYCPPWFKNIEIAQTLGNVSQIFNGTTIFVHPSPGPQQCPVNTYRNTTGGISIDDCPFCPPGYNCNVTGISAIEEYPCRPGYYCIGQGLPPRKCPAGTMAPEGHRAKNIRECLPCKAGRYCPEPIGKMSCFHTENKFIFKVTY